MTMRVERSASHRQAVDRPRIWKIADEASHRISLMRKKDAHTMKASLSTRTATMPAAEATKSIRKPANLSLDSALLNEAKALGINVSRAAEAGIAQAVKRYKQEQWLKENASALASSNAYIEANGLPLARHRQF